MATAQLKPAVSTSGLGGPALRSFFKIAEAWTLSEREQMKLLGLESRSTLHSWKSGRVAKISADTIERISYMLGIFKAINILLPDNARSEEHTSELQSLMRISYAVFFLKTKT